MHPPFLVVQVPVVRQLQPLSAHRALASLPLPQTVHRASPREVVRHPGRQAFLEVLLPGRVVRIRLAANLDMADCFQG
jgi:hypothetical protein